MTASAPARSPHRVRVARIEYIGVVKGADVEYYAQDVPASEEETLVALRLLRKWLDGKLEPAAILSLEDRGEKLASRMTRSVVERKIVDGRVIYDKRGERPISTLDVDRIKIIRRNQFNLDFDPETMEPFKSRLRICLDDGSRVEIACDLPALAEAVA